MIHNKNNNILYKQLTNISRTQKFFFLFFLNIYKIILSKYRGSNSGKIYLIKNIEIDATIFLEKF